MPLAVFLCILYKAGLTARGCRGVAAFGLPAGCDFAVALDRMLRLINGSIVPVNYTAWVYQPFPFAVGLDSTTVTVAELRDVVGARPWNRGPIDTLAIQHLLQRTGQRIDHENEIGGIP